MIAAAAVVMMAMLVTHCNSLSVSEFEKSVGTCGVSPNVDFESRADAYANEFPWNVQMYYTLGDDKEKNRTMCEGTLISRNYVLTTAYCLQSTALERLSAKLTFVRIGDWDRNTPSYTDVPVSKIVVHNDFDGNVRAQRNNIGLVKLQSNVEFNDAIQPICLPMSNNLRNKLYVNEKLITTGWGQTETERRATKKQKVKVTVVPTDLCAEKYKHSIDEHAIDDGIICAGGQQKYDTCAGYAGAPLMALDESTSHWTLIGLTSIGPARCESTGVPAVDTRVGKHIDWILNNIEV